MRVETLEADRSEQDVPMRRYIYSLGSSIHNEVHVELIMFWKTTNLQGASGS